MMNEKNGHPKVSVIMNCLNYAHFLPEAMDSVFSQTYPGWEVIFWDNASKDSSGDIARSYGSKVKYFRSDQTYPLSKARNLAFGKASGEFIAILDCDDIWLPQKLEKQLALFSGNPELGLTFTNSIFFDSDGDQYDMFKIADPKRGKVFGDLLSRNFISSETIMFRRSALDRLDYLFNEEFAMVMDYDLTLRVAYLFETDFIEEPLSKWRMHAQSDSSIRRFRIPYENRRMLECLLKWKPEIAARYPGETAAFNKSLRYEFALEQWKLGNRREMRRLLAPYLKDHKFLLTLLVSHLAPFWAYEVLKPKLQGLLLRMKGR